jgi:hypothetical protein
MLPPEVERGYLNLKVNELQNPLAKPGVMGGTEMVRQIWRAPGLIYVGLNNYSLFKMIKQAVY